MACTVMNLATKQKLTFTCSPKQAVVAAYAQSLKDFCTWKYEEKYNSQLYEGKVTWLCGDFSVFKDGRQF